MAATLPLVPPRVPPSHPLVKKGEEGGGSPNLYVPVPIQQRSHLQTFSKAPFGAKAPSQPPIAFSVLRLPSEVRLRSGPAPGFGRKATWQAPLSLCFSELGPVRCSRFSGTLTLHVNMN